MLDLWGRLPACGDLSGRLPQSDRPHLEPKLEAIAAN